MPRARKPPAVVSAIRSAIARAAWGKLSADQRKARQQRVWAKRKAKYADKEPAKNPLPRSRESLRVADSGNVGAAGKP